MRFLTPFALAGLALIALPVAIHLLVRRRAPRLDFPSLKFLHETPTFRLRPRRIQQPLLLALRVAAMAILVVGLANPLFTFYSKKPRTRVILIDASLSMKASGRTEAAREQARILINTLGAGERAAIIAFGSGSIVLSAMTSSNVELIDAIGRYQPGNGAANYHEGLQTAITLLRHETDGQTLIDLVSDFQLSGLPGEGPSQYFSQSLEGTKLMTHPVGNILERNSYLIDEVVKSSQSGNEIQASEFVVAGSERSATHRTWKLDSTGGPKSDIDWRTESNGQITARIQAQTPDDFDADDVKFLAFELARNGRALMIGQESNDEAPYLRAALESSVNELGEDRLTLDRVDTMPDVSSELEPFSLVVITLHGKPNANELQTVKDYVTAGGNMWFCVSGDIDMAAWNQFAANDEGDFLPFVRLERKDDRIQAPGFGTADTGAPALRFMNRNVLTALRSVRMRQAFTVVPRDDAQTLIRWYDNTSAFVAASTGKGRILLLATSPAQASGELGTSEAFPALASSIARFSTAPNEPLAHEIGQPIFPGLEPNAVVRIINRKGKESIANARDLVVSPATYFNDPGLYRLESDRFTKYLAVNTPSAESESALAPAAEIERVFKVSTSLPERRRKIGNDLAERNGNAWRYFLLAAFVLLIAEMYFAIRHREKYS